MTQIEGVVFDWGGVLIKDPAADIAAYCSRVLGTSGERFEKVRDVHLPDFALGKISEEVFWQRMVKDLSTHLLKSPSLWGEAFRQVYTSHQQVFAWIEQLREGGCLIGLLSNTELPMVEYFREHYSMFDATVFSCVEGLLKPDPRIYQKVLEELGLAAPETIYFDDKRINVEAAAQLGMQAHEVKTSDDIRTALQAHSLL